MLRFTKTREKPALASSRRTGWGWQFIVYALLLSLTSCQSCKKKIDPLPPETQEGKNTFGCLVDGNPCIPIKDNGFGSAEPLIGGYIANLQNYTYRNNVWIRASTPEQGITIFIRNVNVIGKYFLNFDTAPAPQEFYPQNYASFRTGNDMVEDFFITNKNYTGEVEITRADTINKIVSGRFSFTAVNGKGKTIKVTNGRFDCKTGL